MPHTARVRASLARYLMSEPNADLRRRIGILRQNPFPPGSRSLATDEEWHTIADQFPTLRGFIYGSNTSALVYTYNGETQLLSIELAVVDGVMVGRKCDSQATQFRSRPGQVIDTSHQTQHAHGRTGTRVGPR